MRPLEKFSDAAYALLRMATGFMFAFHGAQAILGVLSTFQPPVGSQLWFGGLIELLGGLAVMLGVQTRLAAFLCSGEMAVAYFQFHWKFQLGSQFFPAINGGELAALYSVVFLVIACRGAGKWGLDKQGSEQTPSKQGVGCYNVRSGQPRRVAMPFQQGGGGGFGGQPREMFKAVCADCKKECEVPFRPSGDRPVYCKECFSKRKGGGGR